MPNASMTNYEEVILPKGLTEQTEGAGSNLKDRYELVSNDAAGLGEQVEGFNYPVVQVPSAAEMAGHGGSMGFDANKPFVVLMDRWKSPFVMDDISKMPPELIRMVSKEAETEIMHNGTKANPGQIIAKVLKKHLAATQNGVPLTYLSTWVNDGHDPYRREVKLPPPAAMQNQPVKKGKAMQPQTPPPNHYFTHPGARPNQPMNPGNMPAPGARFGPAQYHSVTTPGVTPQSVVPVMPQIPPPDKVVQFHLGAGTVQSRYHYVDVVEDDILLDGQRATVRYLILVRNNAAAAAGDHFTPTTPAPGANLYATLPDGSVHQIYQVMLSYNIKSTVHTVLLILPEQPEPVADVASEDPASNYADPLDPLGAPAPMMSAEDAAQAM